jgi:3'-5' exoribonuclease
MARQEIKELKVGDRVNEFYLVKSKRNKLTRSNKPFLDLDLADRTGHINAKIWDRADEYAALFERGDAVRVKGVVEDYQGTRQLKVQGIQPAGEKAEFDWNDLLKSTPLDIEAMMAYVAEQIASVADDYLRALLEAFFQDPAFVEPFRKSAGARNVHHAYLGGLLEHTVKVTRIAAFAAEQLYPDQVDRDLLVTGALLHDIGKMRELDSRSEISYTTEGYLIGHVVIGAVMLRERAAAIAGFPVPLLLELEHILLSHHGEREWGAPVVPMTAEAMIIHYADNLDAKTQIALAAVAEDLNAEEIFTEYHKTMARHFYKRPGTNKGTGSASSSSKGGKDKD